MENQKITNMQELTEMFKLLTDGMVSVTEFVLLCQAEGWIVSSFNTTSCELCRDVGGETLDELRSEWHTLTI